MPRLKSKVIVEKHADAFTEIEYLFRLTSERVIDGVAALFTPAQLAMTDLHSGLARHAFWQEAVDSEKLNSLGWQAHQRPSGGYFMVDGLGEVLVLKCPPNVMELPEAQEGVTALFPAEDVGVLPFDWNSFKYQQAVYWDADTYGIVNRMSFVVGVDLSKTHATVFTEYPLPRQNLMKTNPAPETSHVEAKAESNPFQMYLEDTGQLVLGANN